MSSAREILFLPGAAGRTGLWRSAAACVRRDVPHVFIPWPGFGGCPADPAVCRLDDLAERIARTSAGTVDICAHSMGGVVALLFALAHPNRVRRLVLAATSGGLNTLALGATDWRAEPPVLGADTPRWFMQYREDLSSRLAHVSAPTLLVWGDRDALSPVAVGERLNALLPHAELLVVPGGDHDVVQAHATAVGPRIRRHLQQ